MDLSKRVSAKDINEISSRRNTPEFEPGFDKNSSSDDLDSMFDDISFDDIWGDDSSGSGGFDDIWGDDSSSSEDGGKSSGTSGNSSIWGDSSSSSGGVLGGGQVSAPRRTIGDDLMDKGVDIAIKSAGVSKNIIKQFISGVKNRTAAELARYFSICILTALIELGLSIILGVVFSVAGLGNKFIGLSWNIAGNAICLLGIGLMGLAVSGGIVKSRIDSGAPIAEGNNSSNTSESSDIDWGDEDDDWNFDDNDSDDDDWDFDNDIDEMLNSPSSSTTTESKPSIASLMGNEVNEKIDFNAEVSKVESNVAILTREKLLKSMIGLLPNMTPNYKEERTILPNSDEFNVLETICVKALAAAANKDKSEITSQLEEAVETCLAYRLRVERVKGLSNLARVEAEMAAYFKNDADDEETTVEVKVEGDFFVVTVTKGVNIMVTWADMLRDEKVYKHMLDENVTFPVMLGIDKRGNAMLGDIKGYESMLIAGRSRSGKSWMALNMLLSLMALNTPEDVNVVILDPKDTIMFRNVALLPHVMGVHKGINGGTSIISVMRDIVELEGERRKKLLLDNSADTIWALRKKTNIKLPVLYLYIDEAMTYVKNFNKAELEEFNRYVNIIVTQFPYIGIRLMIIPHRTVGVLEPTIRDQMTFRAIARGTKDAIDETIGKEFKFNTQLTMAGDMAIADGVSIGAKYVKGVAIGRSDDENNEIIRSMAKVWYKLGFERCEENTMGCAYNRNEAKVIEELTESGVKHIQLDI